MAVLAVAVVTLIYALNEIAREVNRTEVSSTRRSVEAAIQATLRHMVSTNGDYAVWDDAARKLYGTIDQEFVDDSFVSSTADPVFFDTAYLLEASGAVVFAYHAGAAVDASADQAFGPALNPLLKALPAMGEPYDGRSGIVRSIWGPMVVSVGFVVPFSETLPRPASPRILVLAKTLDDAMVKELGQDYLIDDLALVPGPPDAAAETTIPLTDPSGSTIAALTWSAPQPGSEALARLNPRVMAMLALLVLMVLGLIAVAARGISRVHEGEAKARHAATHDSLSGLPNRGALVTDVAALLSRSKRGGNDLAILHLDLDGFKEVNDNYGHDVGDALLRKVASGFSMLTGDHMLVRLGGDEFAVVVNAPHAAEVASDLGEQLVRFFAKPFDIGGRIISVGVGVGIAPIDRSDISVEEVLRRADVAMYQAKQLGRNRLCVFDDSLDAHRMKRVAIAADLRRALEAEALKMVYQPVYDAEDGRIVSAEALVRWPRGDDKPITPAEFIPIAEETGLIDDLGVWTLRRACRDARAWPGIKVSVNVSPAQFRNPNFAEAVANVLEQVEFPPQRLEIEVTETYFITHPEQASQAIDAVRALGVTVALDDFGIGYSSIGYLRRFAFDKLKLDRSMIANVDRDPRAQKMVHATVALAEALGLSVTAEGVETEEEATILRIAGCNAFQGFFFARPAPAAEMTALLSVDERLKPPVRGLRTA